MTDRFVPALIPPSVNDARGRAFAEVARQALNEPDFRRLLIERIDTVDAAWLPFLVREFGLQHFVEPDMSEVAIRQMLSGSFVLHKEIGYIRGVRIGLALLGVRIESWVQWFQRQPMGAPGTHRVVLRLDEALYPNTGDAITARLLRRIGRAIRHTQRASQDVGTALRVDGGSAIVHVGMMFSTKLKFRMATAPRTRLHGAAPVSVGALFVSRIRFRMGT